MKKILTLAAGLIVSAFLLAGCSGSSEPLEAKSYTAEEPIQEIQLDVQDREITVEPSQDEHVHILYSENSKEFYEISVSGGNVLTMTSATDKSWTDYIGGKPSAEDRKITLQVPESQLESLSLSTTNENILLPDLKVSGSVRLSVNGGNISFETLDVGSALTCTAKNGDITGKLVGSYDNFAIQTEHKKGESNLPEQKAGGEKTLDVSCNNGDIQITFETGAF